MIILAQCGVGLAVCGLDRLRDIGQGLLVVAAVCRRDAGTR
jgi:hypothetical protein